jgi:cation diffusion facilitator family transporter
LCEERRPRRTRASDVGGLEGDYQGGATASISRHAAGNHAVDFAVMVDAARIVPAPKHRERDIRRVLWVVLVLNIAVALAKLLYGLFSHSVAMQADGIHSLFDGASNVVGLIGMWFASRPADQSHPYGHGKFETFTAAAIAAMLGVAGYTVARGAIDSLQGQGEARVTIASFAIMIGTLTVNLGVTTWESREGRRLSSEVLVADARHTLSDVLVSSGVIISLILVKLGFEKADGVLALLVAVAIAYTAFSILRGVGRTLGDAARLPAADVEAAAAGIDGVVECHSVRTRGSENQVSVDLHLLVASDATIERGHEIAHAVEAELRARFVQVTDVVVHVEPAGQQPRDAPNQPE